MKMGMRVSRDIPIEELDVMGTGEKAKEVALYLGSGALKASAWTLRGVGNLGYSFLFVHNIRDADGNQLPNPGHRCCSHCHDHYHRPWHLAVSDRYDTFQPWIPGKHSSRTPATLTAS